MGLYKSTAHLRLLIISALVIGLFFLLPSATAQQEEKTIVFLDERPLSVTLPAESDLVAVPVAVLNRSLTAQTITLRLVGLVNADGESPPQGLEAHEDLEMMVPAGSVADFTLTFVAQPSMAGPYEGRLLAYGSLEGLDRLPLTLHSSPDPVATRSDQVEALAFLSELPLQATKRWPFTWGQGASISVPLEGPAQAQPVGAVVGPAGDIATIRWQDDRLTVGDLDHAGRYSGNLQLSPEEEIAVTVAVRDGFVWAIAVLLVGLGVAQVLHWYTTKYRPRGELEARLDELQQKAQQVQQEARSSLPSAWPWDGSVVRIIDESQKEGLLFTAVADVRRHFNGALSEAERAEWNVHGKQVERLSGYVSELEELNDAGRQIFTVCQALKQTIRRFEDLPVARAALAAIEPQMLESAKEMALKQGAVREAATFLEEFRKLHLYIYVLERRATDGDHARRAQALRRRMESAAINAPDFLQYLKADAQRLDMDISAASDEPSESGEGGRSAILEELRVRTYGATVTERSRATVLSLDSLAGTLLQGAQRLATVTPLDELNAAQIRQRLRFLDWGYRILSGLIAVTTGFYLLYLGKETFGSVPEYVGLLLWSTTVDEGLRVARQLLPPVLRK